MILHPSPNFNDRAPGFASPQILLIHYTDCSLQQALSFLCDPERAVSAHYCIDEDGSLYALVDESKRAWHGGKGFWRGCTDINSASIGIELVNPGHTYGYRPFPPKQMEALLALSQDIIERYKISPLNVLGHSDVAPLRKQDPGHFFDWEKLAAGGVGMMPCLTDFLEGPFLLEETKALLSDLEEVGYNPEDISQDPEAVIRAFCHHYLPLGKRLNPSLSLARRAASIVALKGQDTP